MSRLLFAAARGARIIGNHTDVPVNLLWIDNAIEHGMEYHLHPDDEHLQYGPISTALRFNAESAVPDDMLGFGDELGTWAVGYGEWCEYARCTSRRQRSLFLLILAEALADEGL